MQCLFVGTSPCAEFVVPGILNGKPRLFGITMRKHTTCLREINVGGTVPTHSVLLQIIPFVVVVVVVVVWLACGSK